MEAVLVNISTNIEIITHLAQKTLDELAEMQAVIDEAVMELRNG